MRILFKRKLSIFMCIVVSSAVLAGCGKLEALFGGGGVENQAAPAFDEDTVFSVGGINVDYPEWLLYVQPAADEVQSMYGSEIWDYEVDGRGKTFAQAFKEEMRDKIAYVKIVCMQAGDMGLSLNEDEMIDVNLQTEDYMSRLEGQEPEEKGITPELVRQIYSDNQLAMKVYEHLTLNVDTYIPEDEVRYMVLQYIAILKYKQDANGVKEEYTPGELRSIAEEAGELAERVRTDDAIKELTDLGDEYKVTELIANHSDLTERLSEELADAAFALKEGEISALIDTEEAYFILDCVRESDKEMTDEAKIAIIEARQEEAFAKEYGRWEAESQILINGEVWDKLVIP